MGKQQAQRSASTSDSGSQQSGTSAQGGSFRSGSFDQGQANSAQGSAGNSAVQQRVMPPGFSAEGTADQLHEAIDGWGTDERAILDLLYTGRQDMVQAIQRAYDAKYSPGLAQAIRDELSGDDQTKALRLLEHGDLSLADKIREGASGWGTDETRIFNALERADAADLAEVRADSEIMGILSSELSGADYQLAMAYLDGHGQLAAQLLRAVDGWGTDEETIFRALEGASAEEKAFVLQQPKLMDHLQSDLDDQDWERARRMLNGTLSNVDRIHIAVAGWGTDEGALQTALASLTQAEFAQLPGDIDAILINELGGSDLALAQEALHQKRLQFDGAYAAAFLEQNREVMEQEGSSAVLSSAEGGDGTSPVARLLAATRGMGTDDGTIWEVLAKLSPAEREFIRLNNPYAVLDALRSDLSDADYTRVMATLGEGGAGGAVALLEQAVDGWGTDETMIYMGLERVVNEGVGAEVLANEAIMEKLSSDLSEGRMRVVRDVLSSGAFNGHQRLYWAIAGAGTDEDLVFELCATYSGEWYTGGEIDAYVLGIIESELDTRDAWRAKDAIRGEPTSEAERLERAKELLERERGGISTAIMDSFSASGENADDAWREYQASYNVALEDGEISQDEIQGLREDEAFSQRMTQDYAAAKASVASWATNIAIAIVGIAATILTAGAAGPFVAGLAASLGGTTAVAAEAMILAAALKVGLNKAIQGEGYDLTSAQTLIDATSASLEVGLMMVGGQLATRAMSGLGKAGWAQSVGPSIEKVMGGAGRRILGAGAEGLIDGTIGGMGEGMFLALTNERNFEGDVEDIFGNIAKQTALTTGMSAAGGFLAGAGIQSLAETFGPMLRSRMPEPDGSAGPTARGDGDVEAPTPRLQDDATLPDVKSDHAGAQWKDFNGQMFGEGGSVSPAHATQGQLGDCYFIAGMAATARANGDDIKKLIKDNGDGTFDVTLYLRETAYSNPVPVTRTVDMRLPTQGSKPLYGGMGNTDELWPAILEKRFAMEMGGYGNIEGGTVDGLMKGNWGASEILRGKPERYFSTGRLSDDQALRMFQEALEADKPITVDSLNMADDAALAAEAKKWNVYGNHAYAVEAVDLASKTVTLQNPWGSSHVKELPIADFMRFYRGVRVGD